ncbi:hypothetical protein FRC03_011282 [Tulasnella sp. 419]|nr:hypothetical protein FRC02_010994 [Tulasnella sp. 418]KAG8955224.1 hypothetical protein FRC03_011282 [Tulasnella sp. 419]
MVTWSKYSIWRTWEERHTIEQKLFKYGVMIGQTLNILELTAKDDGANSFEESDMLLAYDKQHLFEIQHGLRKIHKLVFQLRDVHISKAPGSIEYEEATAASLEFSINPKSTILRPLFLGSEIERIGEQPLFSGSIYDTYKGLFLGKMSVAMKVIRGPHTPTKPPDIRVNMTWLLSATHLAGLLHSNLSDNSVYGGP